MSPMVSMPYFASRRVLPSPICQKAVNGFTGHSRRLYCASSSSAMRTPSRSAGTFFATMSMPTFARYRFGPMPAVAVMPVAFSTSRMMVRTMKRAGAIPARAASARYRPR